MPSFDVLSNVKVVASHGAEALSADQNGDTVDGQGFESVLHIVEIGAGGITFTTSNKVALELEESDDDSAWTDVTSANDVNVNTNSSVGVVTAPDSSGMFAEITSAAMDDMSYAIGYRGAKRYSRVVLNFSGTHGTATPISASAILSRAAHRPV